MTDSAQVRRLEYRPALDGIRCLAVLAVVMYHLGYTVFKGGYVGVDVFFVLSGYLITALLLLERESTGSISLRGFFGRRVRRLAPSLVVVCALVLVAYTIDVSASQRTETLVGVPTALGYLTTWVLAFGWWGCGFMAHAWSLSVEETFYAIFPVAFVLLARRFQPRWVFLATAGAIVYYLAAGNLFDWDWERIFHGPDTRAQQLLIGCSLAVALHRCRDVVPMVVKAVAAGIGIVVLVLWTFTVQDSSALYADVGQLITALAAVAILWFLVTAPASWLAKGLALAPLVWIGRRSYTVYLAHFPVIGLLEGQRRVVMLVLVMSLTLAYAAVSYRVVELPFLRRRSTGASTGTA